MSGIIDNIFASMRGRLEIRMFPALVHCKLIKPFNEVKNRQKKPESVSIDYSLVLNILLDSIS
jgi:hypothetical protein